MKIIQAVDSQIVSLIHFMAQYCKMPLKGTTATLTKAILDFSAPSDTNQQIVPPNRYDKTIPTIFIEANLFQDETLLTSDSGLLIMRLQAAVPKSFPL